MNTDIIGAPQKQGARLQEKQLPRDIDEQVQRAVKPHERHCVGEEIPPRTNEGLALHA